jgi:hypothetical protein
MQREILSNLILGISIPLKFFYFIGIELTQINACNKLYGYCDNKHQTHLEVLLGWYAVTCLILPKT